MIHSPGICRPRQLPNPETCPLPELEQAMACCPDGKSYRRLNAIHLLFIGVAFDLVLRNCGRGERCLRLWISRFNAQGIDGLTCRPRPGRPRKLASAGILPLVDHPSLAGQLHLTAVKLSRWLKQEKPFDLSRRPRVLR